MAHSLSRVGVTVTRVPSISATSGRTPNVPPIPGTRTGSYSFHSEKLRKGYGIFRNQYYTAPVSDLDGRIGGIRVGYDLNADWNGTQLSGRIGGTFEGKDIRLTLNGNRVDRRVGGHIGGFNADGELSVTELRVRLGGVALGDDVRATLTNTSAEGRFSGWIDGKDLQLKLEGNRLHGRIGGVLNGKDVNVRVDGVPLGVAVLAALCAYKALEDHEAGQRTEEQRNS